MEMKVKRYPISNIQYPMYDIGANFFVSIYGVIFYLLSVLFVRRIDFVEHLFWIFVAKLTNWHWYAIEQDKVYIILNMTSYSSIKDPRMEADFFIAIGKYFVLGGARMFRDSAHLFIHKSQYEKIFLSARRFDEKTEKKLGLIELFYRTGTIDQTTYKKQYFSVKHNEYKFQTEVIDQVLKIYQQKDKCVCIFSGPPRACKSYTSLLINKRFSTNGNHSYFCDSFNPIDHGDNFSLLYSIVSPKKDSPLVVMLEEFDAILLSLDKEKSLHLNQRVMVQTKKDWNLFLDKFDRGMYPHVILVMTTNKSFVELEQFDKSFLREGRVDFKHEFHLEGRNGS